MEVHANTKISNILKEHPGALDAIMGISTHFEKLRNPLIRKPVSYTHLTLPTTPYV